MGVGAAAAVSCLVWGLPSDPTVQKIIPGAEEEVGAAGECPRAPLGGGELTLEPCFSPVYHSAWISPWL